MDKGVSIFGILGRTAVGLVAFLMLIITWLNWQVALLCAILVFSVYLYNRRVIRQQGELLQNQLDSMAKSVTQASNFALQNLPIAIAIVDKKSRLCWTNSVFRDWMQFDIDKTQRIAGLIPTMRMDKIWGRSGFLTEKIHDRYYRIVYKFIDTKEHSLLELDTLSDNGSTEGFMAFYFDDVTETERIRQEAEGAVPVFCYLQMDNIDDVTKGFSEVEYTNLWAEVNNVILEEIDQYDGFIRGYTDDAYIACFSRSALDDMIEKNFPILSRVHSIPTSRRIPVTISMGIAAAEPSMKEQSERARAGLDLSLGRGGDQASVYIGSDVKFYGGKTQGSEKNTRVRARVVSQAIRELMNDCSNVIIMGHEREDYDSIGGAIGVAAMARQANKQVHIAISDQTLAIKKLTDLFQAEPGLEELFITPQDAADLTTEDTLVFVVDVHRPDMVSAPKALQQTNKRVVIDHHRRASAFIEKPMLTYLEPASSSTSELVTELIQYFTDHVELTQLEASVLYSGIVVDTKNFVVQTGARTFDAASYLRRAGADLALVRHLFMDSFESMQVRSEMITNTERIESLAFSHCPSGVADAMIMSAQVADILISIEGIEASFVFYNLSDGGIGVSARSQGEINVQVIMEALGGGGHRTVAATQLYNMNMTEAKAMVMEVARKALEDMKKEEEE